VLLWPALLIVSRNPPQRRVFHLLAAGAIALAVYVLTNPYVVFNFFFNPEALSSNIGNSTAMYSIGRIGEGLRRVAELMLEGGGLGIVLLGLAGAAFLANKRGSAMTIIAAPALGILLIAVAIGAGKPAEYARFLLYPLMLLAMFAGIALVALTRAHALLGLAIAVGLTLTTPALPYLESFYRDVRLDPETRFSAAKYLAAVMAPDDAIGLLQEPAPYSVPPLDFSHRRVLLLPTGGSPTPPVRLPEWVVFTGDQDAPAHAWWRSHYTLDRRFPPADQRLTPITWANKAVFIYRLDRPASPRNDL
jgi:hypothetical protein